MKFSNAKYLPALLLAAAVSLPLQAVELATGVAELRQLPR